MKKCSSVSLVFLVCLLVLPFRASAGECPFSLTVAGQFVPFVSGDAGSGEGVPGYDDAFDSSIGFAVEGVYSLNSRFSLLAGVAHEQHSGNTYKGISFDDLDILPVYLGIKFHLPCQKQDWLPYLRTDVGFARFSSVDISYDGVSTQYWDDSWEFLFDVGAGIEYRLGKVGIFAELRLRYLDDPSATLDGFSNSDNSWSIPLYIGITINF